jgi:A nuclease family of the HNH/ENDO VII superfamily with conserved AHH
MAANISNSPQRFDYARTETDDDNNQDEAATPDGQTPSQSETNIATPTEQQGQSSGDGGSGDAGTHDSSTPAPPPEEATSFPAQFRYGLGEINIGRPDYARTAFEQTDRAKPDTGATNPRRTALAPTPRAENTSPSFAKPTSMPKPDGITAPVTPATSPPPASRVDPYLSLFVPGNAGWDQENFTIDNPVLYPPATPARDASTMAEANAYGQAHDLSPQDTAKLAALMANNHSPGREWLSLRPEVLTQVLDAIKANPDGSFDVTGVFGGALGYYDARINIPIEARLDENGNVVTETGSAESSCLTPLRREGWVYQAGADGGPGTYHVSDATLARYNAPYQPMLDAGFQQVSRNYTNDTVLSVGAEGGYRDLSQLEFNPVYGLISPSSNYIPVDSTDWADVVVPALVFAAAGAGVASLAGLGVAGSAAAGSFVSTLGTTLDLRAAFRSGAISFVSAGFAEWLTPQLLNGVQVDSVVRDGVQSLISATTAGALQGDIRQGFINGVSSFISLQIARGLDLPRPLASALIRSFSDPNSALTGLLSDVITGAVTEGAQGVVAENDIADRLMQEQPGLTPEQAHTLAQTMLATGREIRDINNGNGKPPVDAETQQRITWMREAIDSGHTETAAGYLNDIVERRAAVNPTASRTDIANQLMRELGIKPDTLGFVVGTNGRVTVTERVDRPTAVARLAAAYRLNDPTISQQEAERAANAFIDQRGIPTVFPERLMLTVVVRPDAPLSFTTGSEIVDRIIGAVQGSVMTGYNYVSGILHGVVDIGRIPFDGLLDIVNKVIGEDVFPDSAQRNTARVDMFNNIVANLDQLPEQVAQYFNGRLERANQMDAERNYIGAARERTELIGDLISMVTNPRTPSAMRILERLGVDPAWFERTSQTQRAFRDAAIAQEHRVNPAFVNADMTLFEAHHTIPINAFPGLNALRAQLREWGIDINSVENGVMLPGRSAPAGMQGNYHSTLSDTGYGLELQRRFIGVNDAAAARRELAAINNELRNGTFHFERRGK